MLHSAIPKASASSLFSLASCRVHAVRRSRSSRDMAPANSTHVSNTTDTSHGRRQSSQNHTRITWIYAAHLWVCARALASAHHLSGRCRDEYTLSSFASMHDLNVSANEPDNGLRKYDPRLSAMILCTQARRRGVQIDHARARPASARKLLNVGESKHGERTLKQDKQI